MNDKPTSKTPLPKNVTTWAMIIYLSSLAGVIIPFANIIAPLVIWHLKKVEHPFLDKQGKEVVNFQISLMLCFIGLYIVMLIFGMMISALASLMFFIIMLVGLGALVYIIMGAIKVSEGVDFTFPYNIRFLK